MERFTRWWEEVRGHLLVLAGGTVARPDCAMLVEGRDQHGHMVPAGLVVSAGERIAAIPLHEETTVTSVRPVPVLAEAGKLRALLKRLNATVKVYWRRVIDEERRARRKGRGHGCPGRLPEWVVDHARLEVVLNCGSSDDRSAWAGCRAA